MSNEPTRILWWRAALCGALLAAGCSTVANPASCADGFCHDPALPFCDVDGTIGGGQPLTCIAVACTPYEFEACRGDEAVVCNATGDDYDVTHCEGGCSPEAGGCAGECIDNSQCTNPDPVCDVAIKACRGCRADHECESQVCDQSTGACAASSSVVYADPMGKPGAPCTQAMPCAIATAFIAASPGRNIVKLAPGDYIGGNLEFKNTTIATIHGFNATVRAEAPVVLAVKDGQHVTVRGLSFINTGVASSAVTCIATGSLIPSLTLDRTRLTGSLEGLGSRACIVFAEKSTFIVTDPQFGYSVDLGRNSGGVAAEATIHRSTFQGPVGVAALDGSKIDIQNSLFRNTARAVSLTLGGDTLPGEGEISFSTFIGGGINCGDGPPVMKFTNNVMYGTSSSFAVQGTRCTHHFALITPLNILPPGDHIISNVDPGFVNAAAGDFHLVAGSPAIDAADPTIIVDIDFDGTARPQGSARDLGAFEFKP